MINNVDHPKTPITLKINIPDKGIYEKRFTFNSEDNVWAAKEQIIHEIGKELKDIQNYGFFVPPHQGKAGKFMDEGRPLSEYSIPGNDQILEFMLKRRIYRSINYDENKLTKVHTKANLKKLMELVEQNNAGQVNQFLEKGLDPNFQDPKTGETPLTAAAVKNNANEVIMFLINGGAYFDFKNRNGLTAVHKAAIAGNSHNIKAFLDLGASPNYRDLKGLTPLYHACLSGKNPNVAELLLGDQAEIGVVDSQEWQEIHQVCRYGHVRHLEQLIYYGADLNARNGSGNTPLHICSLYNQDDCARLLLYRGARRDIVNFANQTAEVVAVVATNVSLSTFIRNYNESDVVPYIDKPTYSTRRRTQSKSRPTANSVFLRDSNDTFIFCSESLSTTSSTPSIHSETSEPMSLDLSPREIVPQVSVTVAEESPSRKPKRRRTLSGSGSDSSYATDSGDEGGSNLTSPVLSPTSDELNLRWRTYSLSSLNKEERGNIPRVKEVKGAANMGPNPGKANSRKTYVAVTNFTPTQAGELLLAEGDLVEVITKGEKGYWQGSVAGKTGWFPAECVEDLKKRKQNKTKNSLHKPASIASSLNKSNTSLDQPDIPPVVTTPQPRQVILHKVKAGFGFQMRGANVPAVNKLEFQPSAKIPALQYVGDVEPGGEADKRGMKKGDYILEVNGNDVKTASHRHVVSLIRKTGQTLVMKLISVDDGEHFQSAARSGSSSEMVPPSMPPPAPSTHQDKQSGVIVNGNGHVDGTTNKRPPPIPSRAPTTSLSSRPKDARMSVTDVDFETVPTVKEDRVISIPRERISSTEQQWHSSLTGYSSLPRRPKSSYGAIIGSPHPSPSDETPSRNFHSHNTRFTTLPSNENARHFASQDDSVVVRRRPGSARSAKDRPKSWMPKVLPTEPPPISPPVPQEQPSHKQSEEFKPATRTDSKRDRKKRFSFRKKKEKDYMATSAPDSTQSEGERADKDDVTTNNVSANDVMESLYIEGEDVRPNSLPGVNKRLSTFKPVTVPHRHVVHTTAVSPELSQVLEKRKSRGFSSSTDETASPVFSPGHEIPSPVFPPPPDHTPPNPPKAKSLEASIKEEMMRRRCNTAPASSIPAKPRRTFEYKKPDGELLPEGEEPPEEERGLDSELAKAVARRAAKMTAAPKKDTHIYENVQNLNINASREPRSSVEEPPTLSIEEKLKKLHLQGEVILPTKFKPPIALPSGKSTKPKQAVEAPNGKPTSPGNVSPSEVLAHGKLPPKTFPKPKKKSPSTASDSGSDDVMATSRPMTLPISTSPQTTSLPPPLLSPEMVATQLLDDVINEEVKRSNWDTASWKDKDHSSEQSSPASVDATNDDTSTPPGSSTPSGKKKYIYKITLVTEKHADGSEQTQSVTQVITRDPQPAQLLSPGGSELPPLPAQPPQEFLDEGSMPAPMFTPPSSPSTNFSNIPEFTPPPPLSFSPLPPPVIEDDIPPSAVNANVDISPSSQLPPPIAFQEDPPCQPQPPKSEPLASIRIENPPCSEQPSPSVEETLLPPQKKPTDQPITTPLPPPEETSYASQLPAPVIHPANENVKNQDLFLDSATFPPPDEFKESKSDQPVPEEIVVPPPIFADAIDGQNVKSNENLTSEKQGLDLEKDDSCTSLDSETVVADSGIQTHVSGVGENEGSKTECLVENIQARIKTEDPELLVEQSSKETSLAQTETGEAKVLTEGPKEVADTNENKNPTSDENSQNQGKSEESVIGEPTEAVSPTNNNSSQEISDKEVPALPESKDQNENVVEQPTVYTADKEEQAPSETVETDVSTDSLSFRETPYEDWNCAHVCDWLASIGMAEHGDLFRENDIRGSNLLELTKEDLRELGVKKLGHRMTITNEVNRLTTNNGAATNL